MKTTAFILLGGLIGWGLVKEASLDRDRALLEEIRAAEKTLSYRARRNIVHPDGRMKVVEVRGPGSGQPRFRRIETILRNYTLERQGRETVAGRQADRLELRPRHPGRSSCRLWADAGNRFLLRFQVLAPGGAPVFDLSHESIDFGPAFGPEDPAGPPDVAPPAIRRELVRDLRDLRYLIFDAWLPGKLPEGFEARSVEIVRAKDAFEGLMAWYSDGIAWILIVEFRADNPLWQHLRSAIAGLLPAEAATPGEVLARRIAHPAGSLMNATLGETEIFAAGQVNGEEMERMFRTLEKAGD